MSIIKALAITNPVPDAINDELYFFIAHHISNIVFDKEGVDKQGWMIRKDKHYASLENNYAFILSNEELSKVLYVDLRMNILDTTLGEVSPSFGAYYNQNGEAVTSEETSLKKAIESSQATKSYEEIAKSLLEKQA